VGRAGGMAEMVEPSKLKALSLNSSTTKKKKKRRNGEKLGIK
jgi:hypothetical protein